MATGERVFGDTQNQRHIARLASALNYSNEQVYRLKKRIPGLDIHGLTSTSEPIVIAFSPPGGEVRVPLPPETDRVIMCSGSANQIAIRELALELKRPRHGVIEREHPHIRLDIPAFCSGKPVGLLPIIS